MESFPKISNRGSVLLSLLASFFTIFKLIGKVIGSFVSFGESLWQKEHDRSVTAKWSIARNIEKTGRLTFQIVNSISVPNELSTKTYELLHKRLRENKKERSFKIETKTEENSVLAKIFVNILTSSKGGGVELPATRLMSLPSSTLALFGEGARGLVAGVDVS
jgi:hypothetical protein